MARIAGEGEISERHQLFCLHYVECLNGAEAARRAGYSPHVAAQYAHKLLRRADVQAYLKQLFKLSTMQPNEVLARLTALARGDLSDFFDVDKRGEPVLNLAKAKERNVLYLVKKLKQEKDGRWTIELHNPLAALNDLGRAFALFSEHLEIDDVTNFDPQQWAERRNARLAAAGADVLPVQVEEQQMDEFVEPDEGPDALPLTAQDVEPLEGNDA